MATHKTNELLGAGDKLSAAITQHEAKLTEKGINATTVKLAIDSVKGNLLAAETLQEEAKQIAKQRTADVKAGMAGTYDVFTSITDVCAGAVGKRSAAGRQFRAIREELNRSHHPGSGPVGGTSGS